MIFLQMAPVVVGWAEDTNGTARIFRWTIANGMQDFSTLRSDNEGLSEMYATFNRHEESNVCRKKPKKQKNLLTVSAAPLYVQLPRHEHVTVKVFDLLGREVATLVEGEREAGECEVVFDAGTLPSGVYVVRLQTGSGVSQHTVLLVK